jgi:hypothetical protein
MSTGNEEVIDSEVESIQDHELEYDNQMASLDAIASLEEGVVSSKKIDRVTMEALSRLAPDAISDQYPLATFTQEPSEQNYQVALEGFDIAKTLAITAAGGILGAILFYIIKLFRSDNVDTRIDYLEKAQAVIRKNRKELEKIIRDAEKMELSPESKALLKRIDQFDISLVLDKPPTRASREVKQFVEAVQRGGELHRLLSKWASDIVNYTSEYRKRVRILTECIEKMYEADKKDTPKLLKKIESVTVDDSHPFIKDVGKAWVLWQQLDIDEQYPAFIRDRVVGTDVFYELVSDEKTLFAVKDLFSSASDQLRKNMDEIEKSAQLLSGTKREEMKQKAQRKAKSKMTATDEDGHMVFSVKPTTSVDTVESAVKSAEMSIRAESSSLSQYRTILNRVLNFYQHAAAARQRVDQQLQRKAMEIQNKGQ